jgi:hypothetical protein
MPRLGGDDALAADSAWNGNRAARNTSSNPAGARPAMFCSIALIWLAMARLLKSSDGPAECAP